jgi:hypothetical protein
LHDCSEITGKVLCLVSQKGDEAYSCKANPLEPDLRQPYYRSYFSFLSVNTPIFGMTFVTLAYRILSFNQKETTARVEEI